MTCTHALLRRVTPGGRCPICQPRADGLAGLEQSIAPQREVIADAREVARQASTAEERRRAELYAARLQAEIEVEERFLEKGDAAIALGDFRTFLELAWPHMTGMQMIANPGTDALALHAQALEDGEIALLGIACAPGFGKTSTMSIALPAWCWARDPKRKMLAASCTFSLARDIAGVFDRLVQSDWYRRCFPWVDISGTALDSYTTADGGKRYAVGTDGSVVGKRGTLGLIDDSIDAKNVSTEQVKQVNEWFSGAFMSRFDPWGPDRRTAPVAVIQQRFTRGDLIDVIRGLGGEILELPARHEPGRKCSTIFWSDPRTEPGEVLAPDVHSSSYLDERERAMGKRKFRAQYQQDPEEEGGNQFKIANWAWCSITDAREHPRPKGAKLGPPRVLGRRKDGSLDVQWATLSIDASGGSTNKDASALGLGLVVGSGMRRSLLRDFTDGPAGWNETLVRVRSAIEVSLALVGKQRLLTVLLEKKAMGAAEGAPLPTQIRDMLATGQFKWPDGSRAVVRLKLYEPTGKGSKEVRASAMEPEHEAGLIELLDGAPWVEEFCGEFGSFGSGSGHDDRVDYTSQCLDEHRVPVVDKMPRAKLSAIMSRP